MAYISIIVLGVCLAPWLRRRVLNWWTDVEQSIADDPNG